MDFSDSPKEAAFRAEAKAYKPTGQFKETFGKVEFHYEILESPPGIGL